MHCINMTLHIYRENENAGGLLSGLGVFVKHDRKHESGSEFNVRCVYLGPDREYCVTPAVRFSYSHFRPTGTKEIGFKLL